MKKFIRSTATLFLLIGIVMATLTTTQAVEPRYVGVATIYSSLEISSGGMATCSGKASLRNGYTGSLTVELKRDGTAIKTWSSSDSSNLTAGGIYYVESGHSYVVTTTVTVYEGGKVVETPSKDSAKCNY